MELYVPTQTTISLSHQAPEMVFQPSLDQDAADGFYNMVEGLLDDIFQFASLVPRVATHLEAQDYRTDLDEVHVMNFNPLPRFSRLNTQASYSFVIACLYTYIPVCGVYIGSGFPSSLSLQLLTTIHM